MGQATLLVVADDDAVRAHMKDILSDEGWTILTAASAEGMFEVLGDHSVDLITLDLNIQNHRRLDLAQEARQMRNVPVIAVIEDISPDERVLGLESGIDEFIMKPYHLREVVLRIRRTLDLYERDIVYHDAVAFDHSIFDMKHRMIIPRDGDPVELTTMEWTLFSLFIQHPGRILSRDEISRRLFGRDWSPNDRSVDGHVTRLRHKMQPNGDEPYLIQSVRGIGYVFSGDVQEKTHVPSGFAARKSDDRRQ